MKIYVASSWRNTYQPEVVKRLREAGHDVYDFRNPPGGTGFAWKSVTDSGKDHTSWTLDEFTTALKHPIAVAGFNSDANALTSADACVLVLPSGASAHSEAGWAVGAGKRLLILLPPESERDQFPKRGWEPELMYSWAEHITNDLSSIVHRLRLDCAHPRASECLLGRDCELCSVRDCPDRNPKHWSLTGCVDCMKNEDLYH